jgi:hypothetical protein
VLHNRELRPNTRTWKKHTHTHAKFTVSATPVKSMDSIFVNKYGCRIWTLNLNCTVKHNCYILWRRRTRLSTPSALYILYSKWNENERLEKCYLHYKLFHSCAWIFLPLLLGYPDDSFVLPWSCHVFLICISSAHRCSSAIMNVITI